MFNQLTETLNATQNTFEKTNLGDIVNNGQLCGVQVVSNAQGFTEVSNALNALYRFTVAADRYPDAFTCIDWDWDTEIEETLLTTPPAELTGSLNVLTDKVKLAHQTNEMFAACGERLELNWLDMPISTLKQFHNSTYHWMIETIYI